MSSLMNLDTPMRYLCLGYLDPRPWDAMSDAQRQFLITESAAYGHTLRRQGHFVDGQLLQRSTTTTLRFENGAVSVSDQPPAGAANPLGGILVIDARDLNHAIHLMSQLPFMRPGGSLEIRPIPAPPTDR